MINQACTDYFWYPYTQLSNEMFDRMLEVLYIFVQYSSPDPAPIDIIHPIPS